MTNTTVATSVPYPVSYAPGMFGGHPSFAAMQASAAANMANGGWPEKSPGGLVRPKSGAEDVLGPDARAEIAEALGFRSPETVAKVVTMGAVVLLNLRAFAEVLVDSKTVEESMARQAKLAGWEVPSPEFDDVMQCSIRIYSIKN